MLQILISLKIHLDQNILSFIRVAGIIFKRDLELNYFNNKLKFVNVALLTLPNFMIFGCLLRLLTQ